MSTATVMKPTENEYAPYYGKYIALVTEENIIRALENSLQDTLELLSGITEEKADYAYAPEKWSIKEVIGHIGDTERVFAYRALCFSRNYENDIAGFNENDFITNSNFKSLSFKDVVDELVAIRRATIALFKNMSAEAWTRAGTANDNKVSVRALANILVGHERHHIEVIRSRYLK